MSNKKIFLLLLIVGVLTLIPFLGYEYNTKGEPRESIVAMTMLDSGNWILPRNNGGEIPYKPMFFHWCIAAVSYVCGAVTEFTSRIPSALALIATMLSSFVFFVRRGRKSQAILTALLLLTCMELHRAGGNCRVDMVLTALSVGASFLLYRWWEKGMKGLPWLCILLMSLATLTKGPVGTLIPCMVMGAFLLLKGVNIFRAFLMMTLFVVLSLIIPSLWYVAAYQQGGQEFLDLIYEENIGRMTNTMAYNSCVEPWWFPTMTLVYGLVPFTLLIIMALVTEPHVKQRLSKTFGKGGENNNIVVVFAKRFWTWFTGLSNVNLYSLVSVVLILAFYSIPQSKRSVYLMPLYPFLCWFVACYMVSLAEKGRKVIRVYGHFLAAVSILLLVAFVLLKLGVVKDDMFSGKHALDNIAIVHELMNIGGFVPLLCIAITTIVGIFWWTVYCRRNKEVNLKDAGYVMLLTVAIFLSIDGAYKPAALAAKSSKPVAEELQRDILLPSSEGVYEYIEAGEKAKGDPVHFFELNFFMHNRIENFLKQKPAHGFLLIGKEDAELRLEDFRKEGYLFSQRYESSRRVAGQVLRVYQFQKT